MTQVRQKGNTNLLSVLYAHRRAVDKRPRTRRVRSTAQTAIITLSTNSNFLVCNKNIPL